MGSPFCAGPFLCLLCGPRTCVSHQWSYYVLLTTSSLHHGSSPDGDRPRTDSDNPLKQRTKFINQRGKEKTMISNTTTSSSISIIIPQRDNNPHSNTSYIHRHHGIYRCSQEAIWPSKGGLCLVSNHFKRGRQEGSSGRTGIIINIAIVIAIIFCNSHSSILSYDDQSLCEN
jgi:hypothetical protein